MLPTRATGRGSEFRVFLSEVASRTLDEGFRQLYEAGAIGPPAPSAGECSPLPSPRYPQLHMASYWIKEML